MRHLFWVDFFILQAWDWRLTKVAHISPTKWIGISLELTKLFNIHRRSWKSKPFLPGSSSAGLIFTGENSGVDSARVLRQVVFVINFSVCFFLFLLFSFNSEAFSGWSTLHEVNLIKKSKCYGVNAEKKVTLPQNVMTLDSRKFKVMNQLYALWENRVELMFPM